MTPEVESLTRYLAEMKEAPRLHVNGHEYSNAILTVDFGEPLNGVHLSSERTNELTSLMKSAAKSISRRRGGIRVHHDNHHGVYWTSVAA